MMIGVSDIIKIIIDHILMNNKFSKNSFFNFPSIDKFPDLNQSLKMINSENVFPNLASLENI